jgi:imidazolonepropionase-like amidohydrolase
MAIDGDTGLVISWPRTEPVTAWWVERSEEDQLREIREDLEAVEKVFDEALAYITAKDNDETVKTDLRYEGMRDALAGKKPVFVRAASMGQIESAVAWGARRGLSIVIIGGAEADRVIPLLKKHDVPVIITGTHRLPPQRHLPYDHAFTLPLKLHEAGVRWCMASGARAAHERQLNHMAATAAAYGLPKDEALKSVTLHAADILGIGATHGSLEIGKAATLIVTTGDPLEITTDVKMAFIDGRKIDLGNRHTSLYEKYREKYRQLELVTE